MNDSDINLITSLIDGQLSPAEQEEAFARMQAEPALRAAYEEQLGVSSVLGAAPAVTMTAAESTGMRATLRADLHLDDSVAAASTVAGSRWARWWAPISGLAVAGIVLLALVVVPDLGSDDSADDLTAAIAESTSPTAAASPFVSEAPSAGAQEDAADGATATTTAAAAEAEEAEEPESYALAQTDASIAEKDLPLLEPQLYTSSFDSSMLRQIEPETVESQTVDVELLARCFSAEEVAAASVSLVGLTKDGAAVIGIAEDATTGEETVILINLTTCEVSLAE